MLTPTTGFLDDVDLATFGFHFGRPVDALRGARHVVPRERPRMVIPSRDGIAYTDGRAIAKERRFTLSGTLVADDAATLLTNYRRLEYAASAPEVRVRLVDDASREITASLLELTFDYLGTRIGADRAAIVMQWEAGEDPSWRATTDTTVGLSTVAAACALGTDLAWPVVDIDGADSAVDLIFLTSADVEVCRLSLASIASGATYSIDMRSRTITHSVGGVSAAYRTGGRFFPLDPRQGNYLTAAWPKLRLSVSTGQAVYRQRDKV